MSDPVQTLAGISLAARPERPVSVEDAAREFEGLLLGTMLRSASRPIGGSSLLDGSSASRMYRELFLEEMARIAAHRDQLGLADLLDSQLATGSEGEGD